MSQLEAISVRSSFGMRNRFKCQVVDKASGKVVRETPWKSNLILDQGLDNVATVLFADLFLYCAAGSGTTPVEEDSGATVGTSTGTTLNTTGGSYSFSAGNVGDLIRFDTGEEAYIAGYTGANQVTLDVDPGVTSQPFTVYDVDAVGLATEEDRSNTYLTSSPNCDSVLNGSDLELTRTYDFSSPGSNTTYNELGWSDSASTGNNLNSKAIISGGVAITTSQQLRVVYTFIITISPTTATAKTTTISGWPVSPALTQDGDEQWQVPLLSAVSSLSGATSSTGSAGLGGASDSTPGGRAMEPSTVGSDTDGVGIFISPSGTAHNSFAADGPDRGTNATAKAATVASYTPGNFYIDKSVEFAVGEANRADFRSIGIGRYRSASSDEPFDADCQGLVMIYDEAQTKADTHTLSVNFRTSWQRSFA